MKRHVVAATLAAALASLWIVFGCTWSSPPARTRAVVDRGPYHQATTGTKTTVVWRTTTATDSIVECDHKQTGDDTARVLTHSVTIRDLEPGKRYAYAIVADGSPVFSATFATAPGADATF